jgi:hypothetical protein
VGSVGLGKGLRVMELGFEVGVCTFTCGLVKDASVTVLTLVKHDRLLLLLLILNFINDIEQTVIILCRSSCIEWLATHSTFQPLRFQCYLSALL